ncbi:MAG TPA: MFS transporter [Pyrinomonadaceae bacterium]|jgi:predicted MFS family arabinose efflux permease|nr:MFS transporter [Pyrinomonadaceae bacterium]
MKNKQRANIAKYAFRFVLTIGVVNLFGDVTYEGARSITGPFLASLGASALAVGVIAGGGELLGYALRSVAGYFADKTQKYWVVILAGYFLNTLVVPALALAGNWPIAAALIIAERTGRGIRKPATDAMISYAGKSIGRGWVFGINEGLDQAGATLGPLIVAFVLYVRGGYRAGFGVLLISALLCLATLVIARIWYPRPHELEERSTELLETKGFSKVYWIYVVAGALIAAGFADFALISFHFKKAVSMSDTTIALFYAVAMGAGAITNLLFGRLFDRVGFPVAAAAFLAGALFAPFVFLGEFWLVLIGMILWGVGMGAQNSLLKAMLTDVIAAGRRSTGFGLFYAMFGVAWLAGSAAMGYLYDKSIVTLIIFSVVCQLAALPIFVWGNKEGLGKS